MEKELHAMQINQALEGLYVLWSGVTWTTPKVPSELKGVEGSN